MNRSAFLCHAVRSVAGPYLAPDALELLVEPRRKLWPGWTAPTVDPGFVLQNGYGWLSVERGIVTVEWP